jgi:hypothetical protein
MCLWARSRGLTHRICRAWDVQGSQLARGRILDWFHIAMKFKEAQRSVFGSKMIASLEQESMETEITTPSGWSGMARAARRWSGSRHRTVSY